MRKNPISKSEIEKVEYIIDDIRNGNLILNHPLQRSSENWNSEQKGNLIRRVLHDGQFLPILICTQYDEHGCEVKYLIDGVQRISTFDDFLKDKFSISKNIIDYEVSYDGILYEQKKLASGKFCLKRDKNKSLIPILDDNGNVQKREQSIDIRGLKYSELPPELQEKIKRYLVSVQLKLECTDEDIQIEILDYNSGTKMNDAQIGKNRLGVEFARIVTELSNHSFIKNKCGFTHDNRVKGVVDRSVNEALMLVNFGTENWVTSHKDLCRKLSTWLEVSHTNTLKKMFDDLDEVLPEDETIKDYLTLKELSVVMANYKYFLGTCYKKECYALFLEDFIKTLSLEKNIPTGEVDEDGEEIMGNFRTVYMTGTKQKNIVEGRLQKMNEMLDIYLAENCEEMFEEDVELSDERDEDDKVKEFVQNFSSVDAKHNDKETALKSLMDFTDFPKRKYDEGTLKEFENYVSRGYESEMYDCLYYFEVLADNLKKSGTSELFTSDDTAILVGLMKKLEDDYTDEDIVKWLLTFTNFRELDDKSDSGQILTRESEFISSINNM